MSYTFLKDHIYLWWAVWDEETVLLWRGSFEINQTIFFYLSNFNGGSERPALVGHRNQYRNIIKTERGGEKKKKSQHQWAVDTKDIEDNQCSARQKAWIKEALAKKQRCTLGAVLKLKAFFLFLHTLWTTSRTWSVMFCFKRLVNDQPRSSMQVKKQI